MSATYILLRQHYCSSNFVITCRSATVYVLYELQVSMDTADDYDNHQLGRAFWLYATLPPEVPLRTTFDMHVLNWK